MAETKPSPRWAFEVVVVLGLGLMWFLIIAGMNSGAFRRGSISRAIQSSSVQTAHAIGLALYAYAQDHDGHYPVGESSTEVCQALLDDGYITDPSIFYQPMDGKSRLNGGRLKPENVCWDVTAGADSSSPGGLPILFLTGYKVTYSAGAAAQPMTHPSRTWSQWAWNTQYSNSYISVFCVNNATKLLRAASDGSIPNVIPADFDAKGKTYRQLTP